MLAHFGRRGQVPVTSAHLRTLCGTPAKLWEFHAAPVCYGGANSKVRASHLKKLII